MAKVVFISAVLPYPVDAGKKVVVSGILSYLVERYGVKSVTYILLGGATDEMLQKADMPCECVVFEQPGLLYRLWNVLWCAAIRRAKSIQESMLYSPKLGKDLQATVAKIDPDLIICDTFRTGQFFENIGRPKGTYVLYMDDLFSLRYTRMLGVLSRFHGADLNVLGNFSRFIPAPLRSLIRPRFAQKLLLRLERRLVEKRERTCVRWFDTSLLINKEEAELLREETGVSSIQTVKPLLSNPTMNTDRGYNGNPEFVFLGDLSLPHNRFSIGYFIEKQMEQIIKEIPEFRLRVIGKGADDDLLRLVERYKGSITVEGFVEDLEEVFDASCAMLIPLLFGSGVKIKTLEALSRGIPILSTSYGVEGISVTNEVDCLVEDNIDRYPHLMSTLINVDYNHSISSGARRLYHGSYSKEQILREYEPLFGTEKNPKETVTD
jgi:glycosyltransferase involved in cell wall biosynthesis